jgi:hypothetical protein
MPEAKRIRVFFLDADTGAALGEAEMPAEDLPASFEASTSLNMDGQDWQVVAAEPVTRAEFAATGELRLTLRKVTIKTVPLGDLLFSLPTICDALAPIAAGTTKLRKDVLEMHEDDWRQVELVTRTQQPQVAAELAAVSRIHAEERTANGFFKKLHVRKEVARPLAGCRVSAADVRRHFAARRQLEGIAYRGVAGLVEGGFAFAAASGVRLYGVERDGAVEVLDLHLDEVALEVEADGRALAALLRAQGLCLVDWCRLRQFDGAEPAVVEYLRSWATR